MTVSIDPSKYHDNKTDIQKLMKESWESSQSLWQSYQTEAQIDRRFAVGDQKTLSGIDGLNYKTQKFIFNIIHQKRQMILGHQMRTRKSSIATPTEEQDQQIADDISAALFWTMKSDSMLNKISEAFDISLVDGLCFMHDWEDFRDDPIDGMVRLRNYAPNAFICDPWWKERDLSDCRFVWTRDYVRETQLESLLPGIQKEKGFIPAQANQLRFTFMPESYRLASRRKDNYAYDQYFYATERRVKIIHSYDKAESFEFMGDEEAKRMWIDMTFTKKEKQNIEELTVNRPSIRLAVAVNDRVLYDEHFDIHYPFTPVVGYMEPNSVNFKYRYYGIVRPIRDTQYLFNRRMQTQLDALESLPTSGINVVEDALVDKMDAFKQGPGQVRVVKKGYTPQQVMTDIQPPKIDMSAIKTTEDLKELSGQILGISEELLGMAEDDKAGITEQLRQGASLTTLQSLFNNLDYSQKILSKKLISRIQKYSPSKIARILGREPVQAFWSLSSLKYDIEVEGGLNTATQKQMQFAQALELQKMGVPISPQMLIKISTLQNKQDLIDDVKQQQEQAQAQQQAEAKSQQLVAEAQAKLYETQAEAQKAYGIEKMSKVADNQQEAIERMAKTEQERQDAILKKVEAIGKLQELDLTNLEKFVNILERLENMPLEQIQTTQGIENVS